MPGFKDHKSFSSTCWPRILRTKSDVCLRLRRARLCLLPRFFFVAPQAFPTRRPPWSKDTPTLNGFISTGRQGENDSNDSFKKSFGFCVDVAAPGAGCKASGCVNLAA